MVWLKCQNCGNEWNYKGKKLYATCPNCLYKVNIKKQTTPAPMEHFNLGEDGVRVLDHNIDGKRTKWICDVYFKDAKVWCEHCDSENCRHVKFALSLPEVQKILKKKGWEINPS